MHSSRNRQYCLGVLGAAVFILFILILFFSKAKLYFYSILIFPLIFIFYHLNKARIYANGIHGETRVLDVLSSLPDDYIIYNDISLVHDGKRAQIDHLVVSEYGIFCIETKNMKGRITGSEDDREWLQKKISKNGGVYLRNFYNPCKQCTGHIYKIKGILEEKGMGNIWVQPVVVFTRVWTSSIKVTTKMPVVKINDLIRYINIFKKNKPHIDKTNVHRLVQIIDQKIAAS